MKCPVSAAPCQVCGHVHEPEAKRFAFPGGGLAMRFDLRDVAPAGRLGGSIGLTLAFDGPTEPIFVTEVTAEETWRSLSDLDKLRIVKGMAMHAFEAVLNRQLELPDGSTPFHDPTAD